MIEATEATGGRCTHWMQRYLNVRYGEDPHPSSVLSFIPVVIYLPDDVDCIALLKGQLPVTQLSR